MPSIPLYQQRTEAQGSFNAQASPGDLGAQTAQAGQRLAAAGEQVAGAGQMLLREQEERDAKAWSGDTVSKAHLQWYQTLKEKQESASPGAPNFTPDLLADFDKYASETVNNAPTGMAKQFVTQHLQALRTSLGTQAIGFESQARVDNRVAQATDSINTWGSLVLQDPGSYDLAMKTLRETMPYTGPEKDRHVTDLAKKTLTNAAASNVLDADPYKMQEYTSKALGDKGFTGPVGVGWIDDATPEQIKTWNNAATTKIHMLESAQAREADARDKLAQGMFGDATDLSFKGQFFSDAYKAQLRDAVKGTRFVDAAEELISSQATTAGFASAPAGDRNAVLNHMAAAGADPSKGTDPASAKQLAKIEAINSEIGKAVNDNPWLAALKYGVTRDATPAVISSPADAVKVIGQRAQTQTQVEGWAGKPISPLQPAEAAQLGDVLAALPPAARAGALAQIGQMVPNVGRLQALAEQLDPKDRPLSLALKVTDMTSAGRQLSELILRGSEDLKDKTIKKDDTALTGWRSTIAGYIRGTLGDPRAENDAIDAAYYIRAAMENDGTALPGFKLKASEEQAVRMVLGQPMDRGGVKTFLPRGMEEGDFDKALAAYTPEAMKAIAPSGTVYVRGQPVSIQRFADAITRYGMQKDSKGNYLPSSGGALVTLDKEGTTPLRLPVHP